MKETADYREPEMPTVARMKIRLDQVRSDLCPGALNEDYIREFTEFLS